MTNQDEIYDKVVDRMLRDAAVIPPVTGGLEFHTGDAVEIGNLDNCIVLATRKDGRVVVVEYSKTDNNYGHPVTTHNLIGAWPWYDVIPLNTIQPTNIMPDKWTINGLLSSDVRGLISTVLSRGMEDSPDYQRGYVWTKLDKVRFLETVFERRDLGKFVFLEDGSYRSDTVEVLDGKQRLSALLDFYLGKISYNGVYWRELSKLDRLCFEGVGVQFVLIDKTQVKKSDLLRLFLDINCAGVPQTEEHLDYVRELYSLELAKEIA